MKERFERIYANHEWGRGSGEGSLPINNRGYRDFLESFIRERSIRSVVDLGCGDWQFSRYVDWGPARYRGYDIVAPVIAANRRLYATDAVSFQTYSGNFEELPAADLLIAKDVLQHWSSESVARFLPNLSRYRYALLTNCVNPDGETVNSDIADGDFRYLDLRLPPFNLQATEVFHYRQHRGLLKVMLRRPQWLKRVLLIESEPARAPAGPAPASRMKGRLAPA